MAEYLRGANNLSGNPDLSNVMRLYCERGFNLAINEDGEVLGTTNDSDPKCILELISAGAVGKVLIKCRENDLYLAFDPQGILYGEPECSKATVFEELFQGSYNGYRTQVDDGSWWYVALNKRGEMKNGKKTGFGQKATKFLPRRV